MPYQQNRSILPNNIHYDTERVRDIEPSNLNIFPSRDQSSRGIDELDSHTSTRHDQLFRDNDQLDSSSSINQVQLVAETGPLDPRASDSHGQFIM